MVNTSLAGIAIYPLWAIHRKHLGELISGLLHQRESNMHQFEGHHFASRFAPYAGDGKQWIHAGDSVEIVGLPIKTGRFPVLENGTFPLKRKGGRRQHRMVTTILCLFDSDCACLIPHDYTPCVAKWLQTDTNYLGIISGLQIQSLIFGKRNP